MEAKLASSAWQVVRAKNHRERRRTTMRKKTIFGIPGRLSFSPPLSYSLQCSPLSSSLFRVVSLSLWLLRVFILDWPHNAYCCFCCRLPIYLSGLCCCCCVVVAVVAAAELLVLLPLCCCWCCCCPVLAFAMQ